MAAPHRNTSKPNARQQEQTRAAIRTTQLVKRLQAFALGEDGDQGEKVELSQARLRAIEILLKKVLPDLSAVEMSAEVRQTIFPEPMSADDWIKKHGVAASADT